MNIIQIQQNKAIWNKFPLGIEKSLRIRKKIIPMKNNQNYTGK